MKPTKLKSIAMIIGSMKSGTSTLFRTLEHHPQLAPSAKKEANFFASPERWGRGLGWYEGLFEFDPARHRWALEASTDQAKLPYTDYVFDRMERLQGIEWRFVYVIRNPLRRIESHHKHAWQTGYEIMKLEPDDRNFDFDHRISDVAVDICRYAYQADQYVERYGRESLKIVLFEDLMADRAGVVRDVCRFLEIDEDVDLPTDLHFNKRDSVEVAAAWKQLRNVAPLREAYRKVLPEAAREKVRSQFATKEAEPRFRLNADEEASLITRLRPDLMRLRDVYGIDVEGKWQISLD